MDGEKFDVNKKGAWVDNFYAEKNNLYNDNYGAGNESVYRLWDKRIWKQYSKKG